MLEEFISQFQKSKKCQISLHWPKGEDEREGSQLERGENFPLQKQEDLKPYFVTLRRPLLLQSGLSPLVRAHNVTILINSGNASTQHVVVPQSVQQVSKMAYPYAVRGLRESVRGGGGRCVKNCKTNTHAVLRASLTSFFGIQSSDPVQRSSPQSSPAIRDDLNRPSMIHSILLCDF